MVRKEKIAVDTVLIEVMIRIDGSLIENRLVSFELPIVNRAGKGDEETVQFESRRLIKTMKAALDELI